MSVSSVGSSLSVSVFGQDDVELEVATDTIFKELQTTLNQTHCAVRELLQIEERNDTFLEAAEIHHDISDYSQGFAELMKELSKVSSQVLGKCPKDLKGEYKAMIEARAISKAEAKAEKDADRKQRLGVVAEKKEE